MIKNLILQFITAASGCLGFAIVFHVKKREWVRVSLGGILSWGVYLLTIHFRGSDYLAAFLGSFSAALYGELTARKAHAPATIFTVIASVPLIPGASLYRAADALMNHQTRQGKSLGIYTLLFASSMSAGIVAATLLHRKIRDPISHTRTRESGAA